MLVWDKKIKRDIERRRGGPGGDLESERGRVKEEEKDREGEGDSDKERERETKSSYNERVVEKDKRYKCKRVSV